MQFLLVWRRPGRKVGVLCFSLSTAQQCRFHGAAATAQLQPLFLSMVPRKVVTVFWLHVFCLLLAFWTKFFWFLMTMLKKKRLPVHPLPVMTGTTRTLSLVLQSLGVTSVPLLYERTARSPEHVCWGQQKCVSVTSVLSSSDLFYFVMCFLI